MTKMYIGLFIGGLLPAIVWGLGTIFQKLSNKTGLNLSANLFFIAAGVVVSGVIAHFVFADTTFSFKGGVYAFLQGFCLSMGITLFAIGLLKYNIPVAQLSSIASFTTLFTVVFALILLSEYKSINVPKILIGSTVMMIGAIIVSKS